MEENTVTQQSDKLLKKASPWMYVSFTLIGGLLSLILLFVYLTNPVKDFPAEQPVDIEKGLSAAEIAERFAEAGVVRSSSMLYAVLVLLHDPSDIKAGTYVFAKPLNLFEVADRLSEEVPQASLVTLTFPEGYSVKEYAVIAKEQLIDFDDVEFVNLALSLEGFLFPDTYFVPAEFTEAELVELLEEAYLQKTAYLRNELATDSKMTEREIITLASVVEREANTEESMRMVAGILLNRLEINMPLQADASMEYVLEKPLKELTPNDLGIDTPYNTYLYRGLPPTPIGNPGLVAIRAVLDPKVTDYFYYITDSEGEFHYAKTLQAHNWNVQKYLK